MGLYKRGSVWWMSFVYKGKQYRKSTETDDRKLAQEINDKIKGQIAEGKWFDVSEEEERTFKDLMERYMKEHSKPKNKFWLRDEISISHLNPFFGSSTLQEIRPEMISRYKTNRYGENAKPATINRELALAKHASNLGLKEWGWCKTNPFSMAKMEKENNARDRILAYEEEERLLNVCPKWLKDVVTFALHTGARMGEILELTWKDVDLFRRVVVIRQGKTGQTKTIPLTPTALEILKAKAKVRHLHSNLVFPSQSGTRMSDRNLERAFTGALKKVKVEGLRFHDLRHTFASRLAMAGKDLYLIQRLLGHREPRMVQRYAHHSIESLRNGIEILETLKKEASEKSHITILSQSGNLDDSHAMGLDEKLIKTYRNELSAHSSVG